MFAAIIIISSFTAAIATSLTVGQLSRPGSRRTYRIWPGCARGPRSAIRRRASLPHRATALPSRRDDQGVNDALRNDLAPGPGRCRGATTAPLLQVLRCCTTTPAHGYQVLPNVFERQDYGFALPQGSDLREPINRAILDVLASGDWQNILNRYLGRDR